MKAKDVYTEKYINYFKDTLTRLMATPSPSGYFREVNALLTELAQKENARCTVSPKGTCEIFIQGKGKETVGLSAHCDTLGAMVRSVSPSGEIMSPPSEALFCPLSTASIAGCARATARRLQARFCREAPPYTCSTTA